jgi:hypothetical protein
MNKADRSFIRESERRRILGRSRYRWEDNIEMECK